MTTTTTLSEPITTTSVGSLYRTCLTCGRTNTMADGAICPNCGTTETTATLTARPAVAVPLPPQVRRRSEVAVEDVAETASPLETDAVKIGTAVLTTGLVCDACGTANHTDFSFCQKCGTNEQWTRRTILAEPPRQKATVVQWFGALGVFLREEAVRWESSPKRMSGLNAALSFLVPGLGQVFAGQVAKGLLLLLLVELLVHTLGWPPLGVVVVILRVLCALDAYRISERRRCGRKVRDWDWNLHL